MLHNDKVGNILKCLLQNDKMLKMTELQWTVKLIQNTKNDTNASETQSSFDVFSWADQNKKLKIMQSARET